jgi:hypothetical protein
MLGKVWMKLLLFNVVTAIVSLVGFFMHVTENASTLTKLLLYPVYGYTLLSFIVSAIAIVFGALEYERKGDEKAKVGIYAHIAYIAVLIVGILFVWNFR